MQQAVTREPLSLIANAAGGWAEYYARRWDSAIAHHRSTIELDPSFMLGHLWLGHALVQAGRARRGGRGVRDGDPPLGAQRHCRGSPGPGHAAAGRRQESDRLVAELDDLARHRFVPQYDLAVVHTAAGDHDPRSPGWSEPSRNGNTSWCSWPWIPPSTPCVATRGSAPWRTRRPLTRTDVHDLRRPPAGPRRPLPPRARAGPGRHGHRLPRRTTSSTTARSRSRSCGPSWPPRIGAERFLREIKITAQLQHPHILPLFDRSGRRAASGRTVPSSTTSCRSSRASRCATG